MQRVIQFARARFPSGEINPVVVKELRQAVRSDALLGGMVFFLVIQFLIISGNLLAAGIPPATQQIGVRVCGFVAVLMMFSGVILIPAYVGVRTAHEFDHSNLDLMLITALTPNQVINGKLLSGLYLLFLLFSLSLPFLSLAPFLGGVDFGDVVRLSLLMFAVSLLAEMGAVFTACLPWPMWARAVIGGFAWLVVVLCLSGVFGKVTITTQSGNIVSWKGLLVSLVLAALIGFGLHGASVAQISPRRTSLLLPSEHAVQDPSRS